MSDKLENNIEKIIVVYDNGETKELKKGMVSTVTREGTDNKFVAEMANLNGQEFKVILDGFVTLWAKINDIK